ncbi:CHC2 zinc finger domain-containing protein [Desulforhopalus sp. 52FAK]
MDSVKIVKEKVDIVQIVMESGVGLNQIGSTGRYIGLCPFHGGKEPSFSVESDKQIFHCFGCGASGDVYSFLMKHRNILFKEALAYLAKRVGKSLAEYKPKDRQEYKKKEQCYKFVSRVVNYYHNTLFNEFIGVEAFDCLGKLNITKEMCEKYKIGYAPDPEKYGYKYLCDKFSATQQTLALELGLMANSNGKVYDTFRNRITIPIKNKTGQYVALTSLNTGDVGRKYLVSKESIIFKKDQTIIRFQEHLANMLSHQEESYK